MRRKTTCLILAVFVSAAAWTPGTVAREHRGQRTTPTVKLPEQSTSESRVSGASNAPSVKADAGPGVTEGNLSFQADAALTGDPGMQPAGYGGVNTAEAEADSASYVLDAASLSTGAAIGDSSDSYRLDWTAGELGVGEGASPSYRMDIGVWYLGSWHFCSCPSQCDYDADGFLTSLDLGSLIDVLFAGATEITGPNCPTSRGDFDCDGFPTSLDLGSLIDHLFAGGDPPCDPCAP